MEAGIKDTLTWLDCPTSSFLGASPFAAATLGGAGVAVAPGSWVGGGGGTAVGLEGACVDVGPTVGGAAVVCGVGVLAGEAIAVAEPVIVGVAAIVVGVAGPGVPGVAVGWAVETTVGVLVGVEVAAGEVAVAAGTRVGVLVAPGAGVAGALVGAGIATPSKTAARAGRRRLRISARPIRVRTRNRTASAS